MILSAMFADTSIMQGMRRKAPVPSEVAGMRTAHTAQCAPFTGGLPRPQLGRESLLSWWDDEASLDAFIANDEVGQAFATGFQLRLEPVRVVGIWPDSPMSREMTEGVAPFNDTEPAVAITLGRAYGKSLLPFAKVNSGLEEQFLGDSTGTWGTAMSNLRTLFVATLTVWSTAEDAQSYMRTKAHGDAVTNHFDPSKDPTGHTFVTGGGFWGFRPLRIDGALTGRNATPAGLLAGI